MYVEACKNSLSSLLVAARKAVYVVVGLGVLVPRNDIDDQHMIAFRGPYFRHLEIRLPHMSFILCNGRICYTKNLGQLRLR